MNRKPLAAEHMSTATFVVVCVIGAACWSLIGWAGWWLWRWFQ